MLHDNLDNRPGIVDEVIGVQLKFFELGILSHEILNGVFELGDNRLELFFPGRGFNVKDDFLLDSEFAGDRQRIGGGTSVRVVIDCDFGHEGKMKFSLGNAMTCSECGITLALTAKNLRRSLRDGS